MTCVCNDCCNQLHIGCWADQLTRLISIPHSPFPPFPGTLFFFYPPNHSVRGYERCVVNGGWRGRMLEECSRCLDQWASPAKRVRYCSQSRPMHAARSSSRRIIPAYLVDPWSVMPATVLTDRDLWLKRRRNGQTHRRA